MKNDAKSSFKMASNHEGGATTTSIRDGVVPVTSDSSVVVVPDWKRELIERRKSLAKITTTPTTGEHNKSKNQRRFTIN